MLCALLAACDARLGQRVAGGGPIDAPASSTPTDSGGGAITPIDAAVDAASACPSGRVVFLNFAGDNLTQAAASDATQDEAIWVGLAGGGITTATMPEWRPGAADRTTQIQGVVTALRRRSATIAPTITFVTTRPAHGPYVMIGFGGTMGDADVPYTGAVNHLDCGDTNKNDLGWVFESASTVTQAANLAAGAIAFGTGGDGYDRYDRLHVRLVRRAARRRGTRARSRRPHTRSSVAAAKPIRSTTSRSCKRSATREFGPRLLDVAWRVVRHARERVSNGSVASAANNAWSSASP